MARATARIERVSDLDPRDRELVAAGLRARRRAVAPYSRFKVGVALRTRTGTLFTGCNIENASYGLTMCAERVAVFKAISEGQRRFEALSLVADCGSPISPCGSCRQILWEMCGDVVVYMANLRGQLVIKRISELFPMPFDRHNL